MKSASTIAVIILTYNEEEHIERCINSIQGIANEIYVVDSCSEDNTIKIAKKLGVNVLQNEFVNQSVQFNWALSNCSIHSEWIFRIDADEYLVKKSGQNLQESLKDLPEDVHGILLKRKIVFLGKAIEHGGWYPKWNLRIFRYGKGKSESRWMDEHIVLSKGRSVKKDIDIVDENLNDLTWWTSKHNRYATREAVDHFLTLAENESAGSVEANIFGNDAERKRWLKQRYSNFPLFIRPFLNFIYRYIILVGFLDGKQGFIWHVLQGFWYRFLVDAKIFELNRKFNGDKEKIVQFIKDEFKMD